MNTTTKVLCLLFAVSLSALPVRAQGIIETVVGNFDPNGFPATTVGMFPQFVASDSSGNLFVSAGGVVFKIDTAGRISIVAGMDHYWLDGGSTLLHHPDGFAVDTAGNLYIAQSARVNKLDVAGIVTTIAGIGSSGYSGDGGPATSARLSGANGLAVDAAGNLYIADSQNHRIRKVDATGIITTVAGNGSSGYGGDGGPATSANLGYPDGLAMDAAGNLYIANGSRVRKMDAAGIITTVAGNGSSGYSGDGGPATSASLIYASGLAFDAAGNLYIADRYRIRKVDAAGIITTVTGNGSRGYCGDGGPAVSACFDYFEGIAVDAAGNLYIADTYNYRLRKVDAAGIITTVAGNGEAEFFGEGIPAIRADLRWLSGLTVDTAGNLYIAEAFRVRKVDAAGIITTAAGNGSSGYCGDGGPAVSACLSQPRGLAVDAAGNLYIADFYNYRVRKVDTAGIITTVAGNGWPDFSGDGGPATSASLNNPNDIAVDAAGNLYIADLENYRVRKVDTAGIITTVAGGGTGLYCGDGGPATNACLGFDNQHGGLALDAAGNLYIADTYNHRIRKVDTAGIITTVAGTGGFDHSGDGGPAINASLRQPCSLAVDTAGNLFVAGYEDLRVRKVDTAGIITTVAGNGEYGYSGDGGPATSARLGDPDFVATDAAGNLYIADYSAGRVRRVTFNQPPVCEALASVAVECGGTTTAVDLDGSSASDPDGDPLAFSWTTDCPGGSFDDATSATSILTVTSAAPGVCAPLECSATLTVTDGGGLADTCVPTTVIVADTLAPVIELQGEAAPTLECSIDTFTDPGATAADACDPDVAVVAGGATVDPTVVGEYLITYEAADACGNTAVTAIRAVTVADTTAPVIQQLAASPDQLWPPNHRMVEVTVSAVPADACDGAPACTIVAVASDEPIDGTGDGDTAPDWQIVDGSTVLLRAERAGGGDGRVYTVSVSCTDAAGNAADGETTVSVPHRRGR